MGYSRDRLKLADGARTVHIRDSARAESSRLGRLRVECAPAWVWREDMQDSPHTKTRNHLLDALPAASLERLEPHFESVALTIGEPVHAVEHVYFPTAGMISVVATMADCASVEIGIVVLQGMHSGAALLSEDTPFQTAMGQLPGRALRLKTRLLRQEMQVEAALQKLLLRYAQAVLSAVAQSAACNRLHLLEQPCARWLLACHERAGGDAFPMTHGFVAMMPGVRRPGGTRAARPLRGDR